MSQVDRKWYLWKGILRLLSKVKSLQSLTNRGTWLKARRGWTCTYLKLHCLSGGYCMRINFFLEIIFRRSLHPQNFSILLMISANVLPNLVEETWAAHKLKSANLSMWIVFKKIQANHKLRTNNSHICYLRLLIIKDMKFTITNVFKE